MGDPISVASSVFSPITDAMGLTNPDITGAPSNEGKNLSLAEQNKRAERERANERRRRQAIAAQNRLTKTSPLGASLKENSLGATYALQGR